MGRTFTLLFVALVVISVLSAGCRLRDRTQNGGEIEIPAAETREGTGSITLPPTNAPDQPTALPAQPTTDPAITALEDNLLSGFDQLATQNAAADDLSDTDSVVDP